jgi:hypothetical protein
MKDSLEPEQEIVNRLVVYPLGKSAVGQKRSRFSSEDWKGASMQKALALGKNPSVISITSGYEFSGTSLTFWTGHTIYNPLAVRVALV